MIRYHTYILRGIEENKIKEYKIKLLYMILPCKTLLHRWQLVDNPHCNFCGAIENYEHFFITCRCLKTFWLKVDHILKQLGYSANISTLKTIVLGYRVQHNAYDDINYVLNIIGFAIYKAYYISECRKNHLDIYSILKREFRCRMEVSRYRNSNLSKTICKFEQLL
jgi:hypothetical protein